MAGMELQKYIDVLGLGAVTVDFLGVVDTWPMKGVKQPLQSLSIYDGGLVGTALTAVSRLGGRAAFAGKLGYSEMARRAIEALDKEGVDTSFVIREEGAEPIVAFVFANTADGQRNIFWTRQNVWYPMPSELPVEQWFDRTKVLLIDFESGQAGIEAAKVASEHDIPVVIDVEQDEPQVGAAMAASSHIIASEDFAFDYTGKKDVADMLKALRTRAKQTVIITRGGKGCVGLSENGLFKLGAYKVDVMDTTGCGDTFHGAFALALAKGQRDVEAARFASAVAALCATKVGGRAGIPSDEQLKHFMKECEG